jgi:hypothetical protein
MFETLEDSIRQQASLGQEALHNRWLCVEERLLGLYSWRSSPAAVA